MISQTIKTCHFSQILFNSFLVAGLIFFCSGTIQAQTPETKNPVSTSPAPNQDRMAHFYVFGLGLGLGVGGAVSWKFHRTWTGKFEQIHEGWFAKDTYAGGSDKIGHFYTDYLLVRAYRQVYLDHNYSANDALWFGFWGAMITRTVMELADGLTTFKFSAEDLVANMSGSLVSAALLANPAVDDAIGFSWTYAPSTEKLDGKVSPASVDNDYNGSVYHMDFRIKGMRALLGPTDASWVDRYNLGISYYTRGYDKERQTKHRYLGLTVGYNLDEFIARHGGSDLSTVRTIVKYFKVPFTFGGIYYDLDHHKTGVRFGLNYFY